MGLQGFFVREKKEGPKPESKNDSGSQTAPANPPADTVTLRDREESVDLVDALLHGKELVKTLNSPYGDFDIKFPSGADHLKIAHRRAAFLGGHPDSSFDPLRRFQFEMWATLDVLITRKPEKFADMDSWADWPDSELVEDLYNRGASFLGEIRTAIRGAKPREPTPKSEPGNP